MTFNLWKSHLPSIFLGLVIVAGVSVAPFTLMSASCGTRQQARQAGDERAALETLRTMTRGGVIPAEDVVARLETEYPDTETAGLARLLRARIKINARDFNGAVALLDAKGIREHTALGDYALLMRASALEQAGRRVEARAAYEQLTRDYPSSIRGREALLHVAGMLMQDGQAAAVPVFLKDLDSKDDPAALLLSARAYEQSSDPTRALAAYRRLFFYAPAAAESAEAAAAIPRLNSTTSPASADEAIARADRLFDARRFAEATNAYADAFSRFPATALAPAQLRRGIAASNARRTTDAVMALNSVPSSAGEMRAEALFYLAQTYAHARQWPQTRSTLDELHRAYPGSPWTPRAFTAAGQIAESAKNITDATFFDRSAVSYYPGVGEVAAAQFALAWQAHEARNFQESSNLLAEHLAAYADKNTDYRGRAGYWAARDFERAGKLSEARALYRAMQSRYDANWYGYLAKQRLEVMDRNGSGPAADFAPDSLIGRASANLQTVTVAEETAGPEAQPQITRADQLTDVGGDDWAIEELAQVSRAAPASPSINLALARIYRRRDDNVHALNVLKTSYPDYSQMKPDELTREEWDVFYPLAYWDTITREARAKRLDPYQVAGLIRQESVFNPRARSSANAYGLMQLLVPTGTLVAKKYGLGRAITADSLFEPPLNIELGTAYLRDQLDKFGRIEYVAAAYNAGPLRLEQWRSTLPLQIDEWAEAIPFKETRGYVQGVVRNTLQYKRLYDAEGRFLPEVGTHSVSGSPGGSRDAQNGIRRQRISGEDEEE